MTESSPELEETASEHGKVAADYDVEAAVQPLANDVGAHGT